MTYCKNIFLNLVKVWGIIIFTVVPLLGLLIVYPNLMPHFNDIISHHQLMYTVFRWCILGAIYGIWPIFMRKFGQRKYWPPEQIEYWIKKRSKVMVWLVLFELIVNEKLLMAMIGHFWK